MVKYLLGLLAVLAVALSLMAGTASASAVDGVDDTCTRFLNNNIYSCWVACDNYSFYEDCLSFTTTSEGHFNVASAEVGETLACSCDNRVSDGTEFNESHSFLCVFSSGGIAFDGTVNRSINFDGNLFETTEGVRNCTYKCRLDPTCQLRS